MVLEWSWVQKTAVRLNQSREPHSWACLLGPVTQKDRCEQKLKEAPMSPGVQKTCTGRERHPEFTEVPKAIEFQQT